MPRARAATAAAASLSIPFLMEARASSLNLICFAIGINNYFRYSTIAMFFFFFFF